MASPGLSPFPMADETFVNVSLQIDPNWIHKGQRTGSTQGLFDKLVFAFVDQTEEGFTENSAVNYASSDVIGRDEQFKTYTGNENRVIPVTFRLMAQGNLDQAGPIFEPAGGDTGLSDAGDDTPSIVEVVKPARWIESLQHPIADPGTGLSYAPPPLILIIGQLLVARVVMSECSIKWDMPFRPGTMLPHGATLQCTFTMTRSGYAAGDNVFGQGVPVYDMFIELPTQGP